MARIPREPMNNPDERSSSTSWTALGILLAVVLALIALITLLRLIA